MPSSATCSLTPFPYSCGSSRALHYFYGSEFSLCNPDSSYEHHPEINWTAFCPRAGDKSAGWNVEVVVLCEGTVGSACTVFQPALHFLTCMFPLPMLILVFISCTFMLYTSHSILCGRHSLKFQQPLLSSNFNTGGTTSTFFADVTW